MMTVKVRRSIAGRVLAGIGVGVVLADVTMRVISWWTRRPYDLDHTITLTGTVLGFVGFWIVDSKKTTEAIQIAGELRFGRRKTDQVAEPDTITVTIPKITGEHMTSSTKEDQK